MYMQFKIQKEKALKCLFTQNLRNTVCRFLEETDGKETNIGYMKKLKSKEKNQSKKLNN